MTAAYLGLALFLIGVALVVVGVIVASGIGKGNGGLNLK